MAFKVSRLRRWLVGAAAAAIVGVSGMYFYARHRVQDALKQVPAKIGLEIQQSADGFTISRSEAGRTLFKLQASKAVQFKAGGHAELHDVAITLYGRDSTRFDQIYGSDFEYDPHSGEVRAKGEVQIDLEANPAGVTSRDQSTPKELKNPVHLKTSGLVFQEKTGDAYTREKVEFRVPQATGSSVGLSYAAKANLLVLQSQVQIAVNGPGTAALTADRGVITKAPRQVVLEGVHLEEGKQICRADKVSFFLRDDNTLEAIKAQGHVSAESPNARLQSGRLDAVLSGGREPQLRSAVFSSGVEMQSAAPQAMTGSGGRLLLTFGNRNLLSKARLEENVRLSQQQKPAKPGMAAQSMDLTAPAIDFFLAGGKRLQRAVTSGNSQFEARSTGSAAPAQTTVATAAQFEARFDDLGQLTAVHGAPEARIVSKTAGQPDRTSTSDSLDVTFTPGIGIASLEQQGNLAYSDGQLKARADHGRYTVTDQMLVMTGSPRVVEGGITTTANTLRLNRATGDAVAEGNVKTTYSELKAQPGGALLASSSPIHVTAQAMAVHRSSNTAVYSSDARLWQDDHVIQAPNIEFDREHRSVIAEDAQGGTTDSGNGVSMVLIQSGGGKVVPVNVTAKRLTYVDSDRKAHFSGGVSVKGSDLTVTARQMDLFLAGRGQSEAGQRAPSAGKLDRIVAQGSVSVVQPTRQATGDQLIYTAADDKFVLSGGPPSIFDAEHGKITGVSLTLFRHDDRVLVEGTENSPSVTQTRVAR